MYRSSWVEIDLDQFRQNITQLRSVAGTQTLLVVKANAYGHGLSRMAAEAVQAGVDMLGVATIGEAAQLKADGLQQPVLILCAMDHEEIDYCVANGVHFLAWRSDQFERAARAAEAYGTQPYIHLELDTGMARSGISLDKLAALVEALPSHLRQHVVGFSSHFHSADEQSTESAEQQLKEFLEGADVVQRMGLRPLLHVANSPGTIRLPASRLGLTRLGIAAYGIAPSEHTPLPAGMGPILSWKAKVTNIKAVESGQGVGYGWEYIADRAERIATIGVGYADGYHRTPKGVNSVLFGGMETSVLGRVFMDQCVFRIPDDMACAVGDVAVLLGRQGGRELDADNLAAKWQTNSYDVVAGIRDRVPRHYVDSPKAESATSDEGDK